MRIKALISALAVTAALGTPLPAFADQWQGNHQWSNNNNGNWAGRHDRDDHHDNRANNGRGQNYDRAQWDRERAEHERDRDRDRDRDHGGYGYNNRNNNYNYGRNNGYGYPNNGYGYGNNGYGYGNNGYGYNNNQISGTVTSFGGFNLQLNNGPAIVLHQGTIINPTGTTLQPGMNVVVYGYPSSNGTFAANQINVVGNNGNYGYNGVQNIPLIGGLLNSIGL